MKAPIEHLFYEHLYCGDWCARKNELKISTRQLAATTKKKKNTRQYYRQKEEDKKLYDVIIGLCRVFIRLYA